MTDCRPWVFYGDDPLDLSEQQIHELLGNKAASLRKLRAAGCYVPPWFTISTAACREYLAANHTWPAGLLPQLQVALRRLESDTGKTFGQGHNLLLLAVRSGAAISMPGALDTILNCGLTVELIESLAAELQPQHWDAYREFIVGFAASHAQVRLPTPEIIAPLIASKGCCHQLLQVYEKKTGKVVPQEAWLCLRSSIEAVWNSCNHPRAVAFRRLTYLPDLKPSTAVTIQAMVNVDAAGVMFARRPAAQSAQHERVIIEAVSGSGRSLVTGEITPQRYVFASGSHDEELVEVPGSTGKAAESGALFTAQQARELAEMGLQLERHFAEPLDVEWGLEKNQWIFFQARPIASDSAHARIQQLRYDQIHRLMELSQGTPRVWVRHPLSETLPRPTPLTWDLFRCFFSGRGGMGNLYRQLGYEPSAQIGEQSLLELIAGKLYVQPSRATELFADGWPFRYDLEQLRRDPSLLERGPTLFDESRIDETFLLRLPRLLWVMFRAGRKTARLSKDVREQFERSTLPNMLQYVASQRQSLADCTVDELLHIFDERYRRVFLEFAPAALLPGLFGGLAFGKLEQELTAILGLDEGRRLARDLVSGLESEQITERDELLFQVARGAVPLQRFLDEYGHRAINELELATPRWHEDAAAVEALIEGLQRSGMANPAEQRERARQRRLTRSAELEQIIGDAGGRSFLPQIREQLWRACELLPYREIGKHYFMRVYALIRQVVCQLGERSGIGELVFFYDRSMLPNLSASAAPEAELFERRRDWQLAQRIDLPDVLESSLLEKLLQEELEPQEVGYEFPATVLSAGTARGPALVVLDPREALTVSGTYILICDSLDPGLTPLLSVAKGLVVERGGALSHGAVIARQLGVPALALPAATRQIRTGDNLTLDAQQGKLIIERVHQ